MTTMVTFLPRAADWTYSTAKGFGAATGVARDGHVGVTVTGGSSGVSEQPASGSAAAPTRNVRLFTMTA
jgi:hypothetical protein